MSLRAFDRRPKGAGKAPWLWTASVAAAQFQDPHHFPRTDGSSSAPLWEENGQMDIILGIKSQQLLFYSEV